MTSVMSDASEQCHARARGGLKSLRLLPITTLAASAATGAMADDVSDAAFASHKQRLYDDAPQI